MDAYVEVCKRFEDERIRYVIVGVFGINFYARQLGFPLFEKDCNCSRIWGSHSKPEANLYRFLIR
jgi:hypothetical protein